MARAPLGYFRVYLGRDRVPVEDVLGVRPTRASLKEQRGKPGEMDVAFEGVPDVERFNHPLIRENVLLSWLYGHDGGRQRTDTYVITDLQASYEADIKLMVKARDAGVYLGEMPSLTVLSNVRTSDVARICAQRLNMEANVQETTVVHETVSFAGRTFGEVLREMARDEDMEFWVERGILWLIPIPRGPGFDYVLNYSSSLGKRLSLERFSTSRKATARKGGIRHVERTVDEEGQEREVQTESEDVPETTSSTSETILTYVQLNDYAVDHTPVESLEFAGIVLTAGDDDVVEAADPRNEEGHAEALGAAVTELIRWSGFGAQGTVYGRLMRPRDRFSVNGVALFDVGPWLVDSVTTDYANGDISTQFSAIADPGQRGQGSSEEHPVTQSEGVGGDPNAVGEDAVEFQEHTQLSSVGINDYDVERVGRRTVQSDATGNSLWGIP